ncbi:MAG: ATP synthase F0 subunit C [Planctomycetaceae bacterium]|nr:ATP synthase F0 subunit C [Planctomycetaceae bacterium]
MRKLAKIALLALVMAVICTPVMVFAQTDAAPVNAAAPSFTLSTIAAGLVLIGAAYGIGKIGSASVESMARQPEVAGRIQTAMILAAALVEGAAMFALVICLLK